MQGKPEVKDDHIPLHSGSQCRAGGTVASNAYLLCTSVLICWFTSCQEAAPRSTASAALTGPLTETFLNPSPDA